MGLCSWLDERVFSRWRSWLVPAVFIVYIVLVIIAIPLCVWELTKAEAPPEVSAWFIGGLFVMGAIPVSLYSIMMHLINYTAPYLQRYIIRILWMVPIYAIDAWFSMYFVTASIYLDFVRLCYEAYVIYNFMAFLLIYLHFAYPDIEYILEQKAPVRHIGCFRWCMTDWPMGRQLIVRCKHGTLQYTVLMPVLSVIGFICERCDVYDEGSFRFDRGWIYVTFLENMSQIWAMYSLVLFYAATREELKPFRPIAKFLCIKFIVFMTFWQQVAITIAAKTGVIGSISSWSLHDPERVSTVLQNLLICMEMLIAAIAHHFAFSHAPYVADVNGVPAMNGALIHTEGMPTEPESSSTGSGPSATRVAFGDSFVAMFSLRDVHRDVVEHVRVVGRSLRKLGGQSKASWLRHTDGADSSHYRSESNWWSDEEEAEAQVTAPLRAVRSDREQIPLLARADTSRRAPITVEIDAPEPSTAHDDFISSALNEDFSSAKNNPTGYQRIPMRADTDDVELSAPGKKSGAAHDDTDAQA